MAIELVDMTLLISHARITACDTTDCDHPEDHAMYRLVLCLVIVGSTLATPRPASAAVTDVYDTVDSVEINKRNFDAAGPHPALIVRGILAGGSTPTTRTYLFANGVGIDGVETAMHCHRLAVLAMSKPGKFQFALSAPDVARTDTGCRLALVAP